jgi:hypothetical protein
MSVEETRKFAKQYMDEQRRILEQHGDKVVKSRYREAVNAAEQTFSVLTRKAATCASEKVRAKA